MAFELGCPGCTILSDKQHYCLSRILFVFKYKKRENRKAVNNKNVIECIVHGSKNGLLYELTYFGATIC